MSKPLTVRILISTGNYAHLGAVERGAEHRVRRTFVASKTKIHQPGLAAVTCLRCMKTNDYARAVVSGQIEDERGEY